MIYYFSGTGNSQAVAEQLGTCTHNSVSNITESDFLVPENEDTLGFVFPIYAWGIPTLMKEFIQRLRWTTTPSYIFMVCTCGDDTGCTRFFMKRLLKQRGLKLDAAWSVIMPNTYISLPGFDIDPTAVAKAKVDAAHLQLQDITRQIQHRERGVYKVKPGWFPLLKSYVLRPFFLLFLTSDRHFCSTKDCTHCGLCAKVCPTHNITYDEDGRPVWNGHCTHCLHCYHSCPQHAIHDGRFTRQKGQYRSKEYIKW